jgi:Flp pilus assembly protein TadG
MSGEKRIGKNKRLTLEKLRRLCRRNRRGAAAVEFAVVAPVFFAFTLGMIEVGRGVMVQQILTTASREGARQAVLDGATQGSVTTSVTTMLNTAAVTAAGTTVAFSPSLPLASGYNGPVTVTVSVPFNQVSWSPSPIFLNGATLTASTTMQSQGIQ